MFNRSGKRIDVREFWDEVSGGGKELVVKVYVTAEIPKVQEVGKGGRDDHLSGVDLLLGDGPNNSLSLVTRSKGVRDPVPNWCLELISLRVTLPRLEQIAEWRSAVTRCCSSKFIDAIE